MLTVFNIAGDRHLPSCCPLFFVAEPRRCFYPDPQENPLPAHYLTKESSPFKFEYGNSSGQWDQKGNLRKVPGKCFLALKMKQTRRNGWCLHIRALMWGSVRSTCFCGCRGIPGRQSPYSEESREENENNPGPSWWPESQPSSLLRPLNISSFPVLWLGIVAAFRCMEPGDEHTPGSLRMEVCSRTPLTLSALQVTHHNPGLWVFLGAPLDMGNNSEFLVNVHVYFEGQIKRLWLFSMEYIYLDWWNEGFSS